MYVADRFQMPRDISGVRTLAVCDSDQLYIGTVNNNIWCASLAVGSKTPLMGAGTTLKRIAEVNHLIFLLLPLFFRLVTSQYYAV